MELIRQFFSTMYRYKNSEWKHYNYHCLYCDKAVPKTDPYSHIENCEKINTLKEQEMPIQIVTVKGEKYYRWGDSGKLYKDRKDAEKQAAAAYASGYKEPKKDMTKK